MSKPVIIGIAGGTASGKTTVASRLFDSFAETKSICIIRQDDYYKDQSEKTMEERIKTNYDHPLAFDNELLIKHLDQLSDGLPIEKPTYDFSQHNRSDVTEYIEPTDVIILEGLFVLESEFLRKRLDIKVFVDADADERILRRVRRDMVERGRDIDNIMEQYLTTVKPMHYMYIEPTRHHADIVINSGMNEVAFDIMASKIADLLKK